jgi:hypothetical protein
MKSVFAEGIVIQYEHWIGEVRFICDEYISVCISVGNDRSHDTCLLVYRNDWSKVKLIKESGK